MFLIDSTHEGGRRGQDLINEDEDCLLRGELDPLPDNVYELAYGEILKE